MTRRLLTKHEFEQLQGIEEKEDAPPWSVYCRLWHEVVDGEYDSYVEYASVVSALRADEARRVAHRSLSTETGVALGVGVVLALVLFDWRMMEGCRELRC